MRTHRQEIELRLIEPRKLNQNAYVESFNGRLRDECLHEHWFTSIDHAKRVVETWRRQYNEETPTKSLGGLAHPVRIAVHRQGYYNSGRLERTLLLKRVVVRSTIVLKSRAVKFRAA